MTIGQLERTAGLSMWFLFYPQPQSPTPIPQIISEQSFQNTTIKDHLIVLSFARSMFSDSIENHPLLKETSIEIVKRNTLHLHLVI